MLNCRPEKAERFAGWSRERNPGMISKYEHMLLVWKGAPIIPDKHWNSMQHWTVEHLLDNYLTESWLRNPKDILNESRTLYNRIIVVDLWTLYLLVKTQNQQILSIFKTIYITHNTVSMALQEIAHVNDADIRIVLEHLQKDDNVKLLSPSLEEQLEVRDAGFRFMEIHSTCRLAQVLNCPALVGEFRFPIPETLRSKVIRPNDIKNIIDCICDPIRLEETDHA
jgi:hypothetical protein